MRPLAGIDPAAPAAAPRDPRAELRRLSQELEGVFINQLFQAMRASVPQGLVEPSPGQELFDSMFDEAMAREAAERSTRGIGEALYRQLARRLEGGEPTPPR